MTIYEKSIDKVWTHQQELTNEEKGIINTLTPNC
jgi:hypothetical protein